MKKVLVFAGTEEGRKIADFLYERKIPAHICVATEYGEELIEKSMDRNDDTFTISSTRYDEKQIEELLQSNSYEFVIDATHPYAQEVTKNCKTACDNCDTAYYRVVRKSALEEEEKKSDRMQNVFVSDMEEAISYLQQTKGIILATTGSKEMEAYLQLTDGKERVYHRVLSTAEVLEKCKALGLEGKHIFAMQGPFSEEMNYAMLKEIDATYLVTKESGKTGGFQEKIRAAERAGVITVVIGRPVKEEGYTCDEMLNVLQQKYPVCRRTIDLIGIGTGALEQLTIEAYGKIQRAELLFGAERMLQSVEKIIKEDAVKVSMYDTEAMIDYLDKHEAYERIVMLYSGDVGFYSGAKRMRAALQHRNIELSASPGISSPVYFMAKLGISWEDAVMTSIHGRDTNIVAKVKQNRKVITLLGNENALSMLCKTLRDNQLEDVMITVGENLSYPMERMITGTPEELEHVSVGSLSIAFIENENADNYVVSHGIKDALFERDKVPMTKMEVRSVSLSKLQLTKHAVCYDIGAGTGSIAIEMAGLATEGMVYAIEKEPLARELMEKNKKKFGITNMKIISGRAMECMESLPVPTHAFIGGSSGEMQDIIMYLFQRNPKIRIVINVIALETLMQVLETVKHIPFITAEYVQITTARSQKVASYQMMMGQNPVYVITLQETVQP